MYINICNYMNVIMVQYKFRVCLKYLSNLPLISSHHPADTFMVRKSIVCISSLIYLISFVAFEVMLFNKSVSWILYPIRHKLFTIIIIFQSSISHTNEFIKTKSAVAGDRTRVTRVTGGNTYHYTTTTLLIKYRVILLIHLLAIIPQSLIHG